VPPGWTEDLPDDAPKVSPPPVPVPGSGETGGVETNSQTARDRLRFAYENENCDRLVGTETSPAIPRAVSRPRARVAIHVPEARSRKARLQTVTEALRQRAAEQAPVRTVPRGREDVQKAHRVVEGPRGRGHPCPTPEKLA
jgi:hypothetical protein